MAVLSLAALTILDAGPAGHIKAAAIAGFDHVGLRLNPLVPSDQTIVGDRAKEQEIIDLLSEHKMNVLEIGVFPITPTINVPALIPILSFSAQIGAHYIVCPIEDPQDERCLAHFSLLCDAALDYGLTALIEFNPYSACTNLKKALSLVERAQRSNAALVIDVLHLSRSGGHPRDLRRVDPALIELVHFCDAPAFTSSDRSVEELRQESRTARLLPGEGELWLHELINVLPAHCSISVEAPSRRHADKPADVRATLAYHASMKILNDA
jgi:sugar phosphate isomerase/epimerase